MNKTDWPSFDDATGIDLFSYSCIYQKDMETIKDTGIMKKEIERILEMFDKGNSAFDCYELNPTKEERLEYFANLIADLKK